MPLYRADYLRLDGTTNGAVKYRDTLGLGESHITPERDVLTSHMTTIRPLASAAAQRSESDVVISRIVGGGRIKAALIATFDGRFRRPDGSKNAGTNADHKTTGPCFCAGCRAERRASRTKGGNR